MLTLYISRMKHVPFSIPWQACSRMSNNFFRLFSTTKHRSVDKSSVSVKLDQIITVKNILMSRTGPSEVQDIPYHFKKHIFQRNEEYSENNFNCWTFCVFIIRLQEPVVMLSCDKAKTLRQRDITLHWVDHYGTEHVLGEVVVFSRIIIESFSNQLPIGYTSAIICPNYLWPIIPAVSRYYVIWFLVVMLILSCDYPSITDMKLKTICYSSDFPASRNYSIDCIHFFPEFLPLCRCVWSATVKLKYRAKVVYRSKINDQFSVTQGRARLLQSHHHRFTGRERRRARNCVLEAIKMGFKQVQLK